MRIDVGDTKPHSGVMVLFVHDKGPSEKDDFVVLAEALQKKTEGVASMHRFRLMEKR